MRRATIAGLVLAIASVATLAPAAPDASARGRALEVGFLDSIFRNPDEAVRQEWLGKSADAGADLVAVQALWRAIEGEEPENPGDPSDPAYRWELLDTTVREARAAGLRPMVTIRLAPDWAEGSGRDPAAPPGTWRPDPQQLADFARAAALRYAGNFPDPAQPGVALPEVDLWQIWAEPNINRITPQWVRERGKWRPASATHFREMMKAAYPAIKAVNPTSTVGAGTTSPFGHPPGGERISPLKFWQKFLCLKGKGKRLRKGRCPGGKVTADAIGSNPLSQYAGAGPFEHADRAQDTLVPDMVKVRRLVRAARRKKTIKPKSGTEIWAGELFWSTSPPGPGGVSLTKQANYLADSLYLLWKQRVSKVLWVQIRDAPADAAGHSGLYFADGTAKPALEAMRFPFAAKRQPKDARKPKTEVWGRAPVAGQVLIERQKGGGWRTVKRLHTKAGEIFVGKIPGRRKAKLRASIGNHVSLARKPR